MESEENKINGNEYKSANSFENNNKHKENFNLNISSKNKSSMSYQEQYFSNQYIENLGNNCNNTLTEEETKQTNIFDHDISIVYKRQRHKNLHHKRRLGMHNFFNTISFR